jgi:hypothetical protein
MWSGHGMVRTFQAGGEKTERASDGRRMREGRGREKRGEDNWEITRLIVRQSEGGDRNADRTS